jgi:leucyl-tRNA synthetase
MAHVADGPCVPLKPADLNEGQKHIRRLLHDTIAKVGDDIERRYTFNTAIAAVMELINHLGRFDDLSDQGRAVRDESWKAIVRLLAPITPHVCEELWSALGAHDSLIDAAWPQVDESARQRSVVQIAVQVNGKVRARLELPAGSDEAAVREAALEEPNVQRHIGEGAIRKVILVPDRLLNIVVG